MYGQDNEMCFGSKTKEVKPPPPNPPTTFDYDAGERAPLQQQQAANAAAPTQASFGSELGAGPTIPSN